MKEIKNASGTVYERGLVTSKKLRAGTNAGNLLMSDFYQISISAGESFANSRLGQAAQEVKTRLQQARRANLPG